MANLCTNHVAIIGPEDSVQRLLDQHGFIGKAGDPHLHLTQIKPIPANPTDEDGESIIERTWTLENWGCAHVDPPRFYSPALGVLHLDFDTPEEAPSALIQELSRQFPDLEIWLLSDEMANDYIRADMFHGGQAVDILSKCFDLDVRYFRYHHLRQAIGTFRLHPEFKAGGSVSLETNIERDAVSARDCMALCPSGLTPVSLAVICDDSLVVEYALDHGAGFSMRDAAGRSILELHALCAMDAQSSSDELIRSGAVDELMKSDPGSIQRSFNRWCLGNNEKLVVELLRRNPALATGRDTDGYTALDTIALGCAQLQSRTTIRDITSEKTILQRLCDLGASPLSKSTAGDTSLDLLVSEMPEDNEGRYYDEEQIEDLVELGIAMLQCARINAIQDDALLQQMIDISEAACIDGATGFLRSLRGNRMLQEIAEKYAPERGVRP